MNIMDFNGLFLLDVVDSGEQSDQSSVVQSVDLFLQAEQLKNHRSDPLTRHQLSHAPRTRT